MIVHAKPLTPDAFAPFGQVLMEPGRGPERYAFAARMQNERVAADCTRKRSTDGGEPAIFRDAF